MTKTYWFSLTDIRLTIGKGRGLKFDDDLS
jgi:hypothetical protein